ncbi:hypothetical protein COO60DRAFT_1539119 [Scenedesmus sp. NREL 46B-D3]|nr:hypothetical protein COO60DRAFT_1539119 [Scenedesmus sp. NREL 46B-D3]
MVASVAACAVALSTSSRRCTLLAGVGHAGAMRRVVYPSIEQVPVPRPVLALGDVQDHCSEVLTLRPGHHLCIHGELGQLCIFVFVTLLSHLRICGVHDHVGCQCAQASQCQRCTPQQPFILLASFNKPPVAGGVDVEPVLGHGWYVCCKCNGDGGAGERSEQQA